VQNPEKIKKERQKGRWKEKKGKWKCVLFIRVDICSVNLFYNLHNKYMSCTGLLLSMLYLPQDIRICPRTWMEFKSENLKGVDHLENKHRFEDNIKTVLGMRIWGLDSSGLG
jgi:hypothetical protein